jgi:uncharacterized membrane protein YeiB
LTAEVDEPNRIAFLDVLRGVALFGILLVNVFSFGADYPAWSGMADQLVWQVKHVVFETKFWMLYSLCLAWVFPANPISRIHHGSFATSSRCFDALGVFARPAL